MIEFANLHDLGNNAIGRETADDERGLLCVAFWVQRSGYSLLGAAR
jgi:hypothetical protein